MVRFHDGKEVCHLFVEIGDVLAVKSGCGRAGGFNSPTSVIREASKHQGAPGEITKTHVCALIDGTTGLVPGLRTTHADASRGKLIPTARVVFSSPRIAGISSAAPAIRRGSGLVAVVHDKPR